MFWFYLATGFVWFFGGFGMLCCLMGLVLDLHMDNSASSTGPR